MCICVPNMKFLCLTLCQGRCALMMPMPTPTQDDDADKACLYEALWLINQMSQKFYGTLAYLVFL